METEKNNFLAVTKIMWIALLVAQILYLVIGYYPYKKTGSQEEMEFLSNFLLVLGLVVAGVSLGVNKFFTKIAKKQGSKLKLGNFFLQFVIRAALTVSVSIYGFVENMVTLNKSYGSFLAALAFILFFRLYPNEQLIKDTLGGDYQELNTVTTKESGQ
jgi:hypothetical protein